MRRFKRTALACASAIAALVLLELALRAAYLLDPALTPQQQLTLADQSQPPRDGAGPCRLHEGTPQASFYRRSRVPEMIFELKPDVDTCWEHYGTRVKTNHAGFRADSDYAIPKPAGILRIVALGDSFTFGYGVEYEQTWTRQLEHRLGERLGRRVEVLNTGVGGYNTVNEVALLEDRGLSYDPDLIILFWCGNDVGAPQFLLEPAKASDWRRSALVDFTLTRLARIRAAPRGLIPAAEEIRDALARPDQVPEEFRSMVGRVAVSQAFDRLTRISVRRRIPVVVAAEGFGMLFDTRDEFLAFLKRLEFVAVEVPLDAATHHIGPTDGHFNAAGNDVTARVLARAIVSANLLRPRGSQ